MEKAIEFICTIEKVQNIKAGGFRVSLDMPSDNSKQAAWLMENADRTGVYFKGVLEIQEEDEKTEGWEAVA